MTGKIRGLRSLDESRYGTWIGAHPIPAGELLRIEAAIGRKLTESERDDLSGSLGAFRWMKDIAATPLQDVRNTLRRIELSNDDEEVLRLYEQCDTSTRSRLRDAWSFDVKPEPQTVWSIDGSAEFWLVNIPSHLLPNLVDRAQLYRYVAHVAGGNVRVAGNQGRRPTKGYQKLFADVCIQRWQQLTSARLTISTKGKTPSPFVVFSEVLFGLVEGDAISLARVEELLNEARKRTKPRQG